MLASGGRRVSGLAQGRPHIKKKTGKKTGFLLKTRLILVVNRREEQANQNPCTLGKTTKTGQKRGPDPPMAPVERKGKGESKYSTSPWRVHLRQKHLRRAGPTKMTQMEPDTKKPGERVPQTRGPKKEKIRRLRADLPPRGKKTGATKKSKGAGSHRQNDNASKRGEKKKGVGKTALRSGKKPKKRGSGETV